MDSLRSKPATSLQTVATEKIPINQVLSTDWWHTISMLHCPASKVTLIHGTRPDAEPESARELRIREWNSRVQKKCDELSAVNPNKEYKAQADVNGQLTLFEVVEGELVRRMWDGTTISTTSLPRPLPDGTFTLEVFPIKYSEWTSCTNPQYGAAFRAAGLSLPNAGVGISVLLETNDGFIPLTRRGIETPVYPGMLYSPGGGPKEGQTSVEAILEEILEETGLEEGVHFSAEKLVMLAYISDSKHQGTDHERPELVGYLPLDISLKDVHRIRKTYLANRKVPEADVWAYDIVSSDKADVSGKVVYDGNQMCPPTEAALSHLVHFQNCQTNTDPDDAVAATKKFMDRVTMYERAVYHPPISRLTREL